MRYADFVANVGNGAGTTMRFITKNAANTFSVGLAQDNNGNVGIGTTSPASKLHIKTSTNFNYEFEEVSSKLRLSALNDARSANVPLQFAASEFNFISGNVGIGTTSPGDFAVGPFVVGDGTTVQGMTIYTGASHEGIIRFADGTSGTQQYEGQIKYDHSDNKMRFFTDHGERLRITSGGYVGIGTETPTAMLQVGNSVSGETGLVIFNSEGGNQSGLLVKSRTNRATLQVSDNDSTAFVQAEGSHAIYGQHSSLASADMTIDATGNMNLQNGSYYVDQVRHSIRPSLNLDFANSKTLDSRITFYRDSIATYYDSKGIIRYANINEPRFDHDPDTGESKGLLIEEQRKNAHLSKTNTFEFDYNGGNAYYKLNAGISPDGRYNAAKICEASTNAAHAYDAYTVFESSGTGTASIFVKPAGRQGVYLAYYDAFGGQTIASTYFILVGDGEASNSDGTIQKLSNGWYRITRTWPSIANNGSVLRIGLTTGASAGGNYGTASYQGDGQSGILIWGTQQESAAFATSYIPADNRFTSRSSAATYHDETGVLRTAPINSPRYGYKYDGRKWVETGLILEGSATNIAKNLNYWGFEVSDNQARGSFTTDTPAPDGSYTATRFDFSGISTNTWGDAIWFPGVNYAGTTKTFSVWVKGTAGETVAIRLDGQGGGGGYNLITLTGDWQREYVTYTYESAYSVTASLRIGIRALGTEAGTATSFYVWGAQLEEGFVMSSYIYQPSSSSSASVTRSADVASSVAYTREQDVAEMQGVEYADWNREEEGTFYTEHQTLYDIETISENYRLLERHNGVTGNSVSILHNAGTNQLNAGVIVDTGWQALLGVTSPYGEIDKHTLWKISLGFKKDDFGVSMQGSPTVSDTSGSTPIDNHTLQIGGNYARDGALNGHIKLIKFYPERLSNAELQALTENN